MPLFNNEDTIKEYKRAEPPRMGGQEAVIYNSDNYHDLLKDVRLSRWDDDDVVDNRTVRFSLSIFYDIKLGKEGPPNYKTPAHEKLTGDLSLIAGNLGFNSENDVCIITNKSSDYTPDFNSLQYVLIVMLKENKYTFAKDLVFRKYTIEKVSEQINVTSEELIAELRELDFFKNYDAIVTPAKAASKDAIADTPASSVAKKRKIEEASLNTSVTPAIPSDDKDTPTAPSNKPRGAGVRSNLLSMFPLPTQTSSSSILRPIKPSSSNKFGAKTVVATPLASSLFLHDSVSLPLGSPAQFSTLFSPASLIPQINALASDPKFPKPDFAKMAPK